MNDGGLTILHLSAFFCLFRFYVIWWLLHFNNAACKKRGTKVRGINQIIPIYPSRSEYARKCPKTVSKTSQQTCCLRELRFLDEIKTRFWHDFYQKDQKLQKFRHFSAKISWIHFRNVIFVEKKKLEKSSENYCIYMHVWFLHKFFIERIPLVWWFCS